MDAKVHPIGYSADDHSEWNVEPSNADVAAAFSTMLSWIDENPDHDGLRKTPVRMRDLDRDPLADGLKPPDVKTPVRASLSDGFLGGCAIELFAAWRRSTRRSANF